MSDAYVTIPYPTPGPGETMTAEELAADLGFTVGSRVVASHGQRHLGQAGTVTGWARSAAAHAQFLSIQASAQVEGRALTVDDYECLIDNEGPVVRFDDPNHGTQWYPGMSTGALTEVPQDQPAQAG